MLKKDDDTVIIMKSIAKIIVPISLLLATVMLIAATPAAANQRVSVDLSLTPQKGPLYKQAYKPVDLNIRVEVKTPARQAFVVPMKRVKITFPADMNWVPGRQLVACDINNEDNLSIPINQAVAKCPNSIIGSGDAGLYLGNVNSAQGPNLRDPVLVAFYGGKTKRNEPIIKIVGYSQGTGAGIYMAGVFRKHQLNISVPHLTFDSSVGYFNLSLPGYQYDQSLWGQDKTFTQAKCSKGKWLTKGQFAFGNRDPSGNDTGPTTYKSSSSTDTCRGRKGRVNRRNIQIKGAGQISGRSYVVAVRNSGTAAMKRVKIKVAGRDVRSRQQRVPNIAPGTKNFRIRVQLTRRAKRYKGRTTVVKLKLSSSAGSKRVSQRIKIG